MNADDLKTLVLFLIVLAYLPVIVIFPYEAIFNAGIFWWRFLEILKQVAIFIAKVIFLFVGVFPLLAWVMLFSLIRYRDGRVMQAIRSIKEPESMDVK